MNRFLLRLCVPTGIAALLLLTVACDESDCEVDATCAGDVFRPDVLTADNGQDVQADVVSDTSHDTTTDVAADIPSDGCGDTTTDLPSDASKPDSTVAGECVTDYDCEGCESCIDQDGSKKCVDVTIYAGVRQCYSDDDCAPDQVCHYYPIGRPQCGGGCGPKGSFDLHEWGVNVVTLEGKADMSAAPERFYGAVVAKPVIYIYSTDQFDLDVRVDYKTGASSETWPVVPNGSTVAWAGLHVGGTSCETTSTPQPEILGSEEVPPSRSTICRNGWFRTPTVLRGATPSQSCCSTRDHSATTSRLLPPPCLSVSSPIRHRLRSRTTLARRLAR
ncbi:MAG TPA: hypothetical protein PKK50_10865 [Myxococcota bacterium]|nr:hypothetical protein [Myxococcota bacterium]